MRVDEVGRTTQGRPFVVVTVTSEANQARLEEIRQVNLRLADPRGLDDEEAERLLARGRTIVAMAYSIHSTEVGGTLSALALLHHLAASDSPEVRRALDETVLLVLPSHNPDGTQLVTEWYRRQLGTEFEGTPPPVLYHPYVGHDNNRDWYMFTQVETRLTVEQVHRRWHPQIMHDVHQMGRHGARLFVPPYTDPWEPNVDPALVAASNAIGSHVAARLTTEGKPGVVTGAIFDAWTPARAYPHTHGGVRVLSETASARLASPIEVPGHELANDRGGYDPRTPSGNFPLPWPGGWWRLGDIVEYQLSASLAVLDHAASNRDYWLRTALGVARRAIAQRDPFAFVIPATQRDPLAAARLLEVMNAGGVEVHRASEPFVAGGQTWDAGSHVISMQQPASAFARTLLQRQRYPDLRSEPGASPRRPYDVTAHTLPLLLGVQVREHRRPLRRAPRAGGGACWWHRDGSRVTGRSWPSGTRAGTWPPWDVSSRPGWRCAGPSSRSPRAAVRSRPGPSSSPRPPGSSSSRWSSSWGSRPGRSGLVPEACACKTPRVGLYRSWVPSMDEGWTRYVFEREMGVAYRNLHDHEVRGGRAPGSLRRHRPA